MEEIQKWSSRKTSWLFGRDGWWLINTRYINLLVFELELDNREHKKARNPHYNNYYCTLTVTPYRVAIHHCAVIISQYIQHSLNMGKKSRRSNNKNKKESCKQNAAAAETGESILDMVKLCAEANKYNEILKIESKWGNLVTSHDKPLLDLYFLYHFGRAYQLHSQEQAEDPSIYRKCTVHHYQRFVDLFDSNAGNEEVQVHLLSFIPNVGIRLFLLYSQDGNTEKAISTHRCWLLANCNCEEVLMKYVCSR